MDIDIDEVCKVNKEIAMQIVSKTSRNPYVRMIVNLGYRDAVLSFDKNLIAEVFGMPVQQLYEEIKNRRG